MAIGPRAASGVRVVGIEQAQGYLRDLAASSRNASRAIVRVGSPLAYAYGIETGSHRSGRLARRAGGVFYLTRALNHEKPLLAARIAAGLEQGPNGVLDALKIAGFAVERAAKSLVVRVTGTLQRSIQTIYPGRPSATPPGGAPVGLRVGIRRARRPR